MYTKIAQIQTDMLDLFKNVRNILLKNPNYYTNYLEVLLKFHKPVQKADLSLFEPDSKLDSIIIPYAQNKGAVRFVKAIETRRVGQCFTDLLDPIAVENKINLYRFEKVYYSALKRNHIAISDICTLGNLNSLIDYLSSQLSWIAKLKNTMRS